MGLYTHAPTACATPNLEGSLSFFFQVRYMFGWFLTFSSHLSDEIKERLQEKLRRGQREGTFCKWSDDEETSGNEHYNHCILFVLFVVFNFKLLSHNPAVINIRISTSI